MKSFRPLNAHPEAATWFSIGVNPPCPGVPVGGPFTSPARAALTLSAENTTAHTAATIFLRILHLLANSPLTSASDVNGSAGGRCGRCRCLQACNAVVTPIHGTNVTTA